MSVGDYDYHSPYTPQSLKSRSSSQVCVWPINNKKKIFLTGVPIPLPFSRLRCSCLGKAARCRTEEDALQLGSGLIVMIRKMCLQLHWDVGQMHMHHNHNQQRVPSRWDVSGASQPPSALCIAGKISARERSSAICPSAGQDGWYYDDFVEAGEDDRGDSDQYADEYNPIFIFRFYQLAECKEEASPVPSVPGLKDQLEQRLAMKKNSQWFIQ